MPQSLASLHTHLIFSTKNRKAFLHDRIRDPLHRYMSTVLQNLGCQPVIINSVEDHVHLLFNLSRTVSISEAVEQVKKSSSKWIKTQGREFAVFAWQTGYGAFAVSQSNVDAVIDYIANQQEHHCQRSFQDEFHQFLKRHRIDYNEEYVWD